MTFIPSFTGNDCFVSIIFVRAFEFQEKREMDGRGQTDRHAELTSGIPKEMNHKSVQKVNLVFVNVLNWNWEGIKGDLMEMYC